MRLLPHQLFFAQLAFQLRLDKLTQHHLQIDQDILFELHLLKEKFLLWK